MSTVGARALPQLSLTWAIDDPRMRRLILRLFVAALAVFIGIPLLTLVLWSFAGEWFWPNIIPTQWTLRWYEQVFENPRVINAMVLSFTIAPVVTLLTAIIAIPAGYAFARLNIPFRRTLLLLFLIPNAFPRIGLYVSLAVLYYQVGLIDTYWGVVFLHMIGTLVYMTWITTATFRSIDPHLEEAARDAGASPLRAFWSVVLPLALPGIIVASLFAFLASLDEAQGTLIVGTPHFITMPVLMYTLISSFERPVAAVFSVLLSLPSLLLLFAAQRYLQSEYVAAGLGRV
jgi:putative spermidine/putrescine transport system permease protein